MMKQPYLGNKIVELRKQKGLTQEDLVEKCNINVRTIQRIEAGETTPRMHTIKMIFDALGLPYEKVFKAEYQEGRFDKLLGIFPNNIEQTLNFSLVAGIVYFIIGFFEVGFYSSYLNDSFSVTNWYETNYWIHIPIIITVLITFSFFMRGFVLIGNYYKNNMVEFTAFMMLITNVILEISSIIFMNNSPVLEYILLSKSVTIGIIMILFGIGIFRLKSHFGDLSLATGLLEITTGVCLVSVVLSYLGLVLLIPLELLELILLNKVISKIKVP